MQLLGYDYVTDSVIAGRGLAQLEPIIRAQRKDGTSNLLFDTGDFLQGNPLGDHVAETIANASDASAIHPMIAAMNALHYDGVTLGNHEFDYGMPFLERVMADAKFPVIGSNLVCADGPPHWTTGALIHKRLRCNDSALRDVTIGVIGLVIPFIPTSTLSNTITTQPILTAARASASRLRKSDADIIVALCHFGIGSEENDIASSLATFPEIDVLLMGHTHGHFPDASRAVTGPVDPVRGAIHDKPAMMPGAYGTHLGVMDLMLEATSAGWRVADFDTRLITADPNRTAQGAIAKIAAPTHRIVRRAICRPIGTLATPLHDTFAAFGAAPTLHLLAAAQSWAVSTALDQMAEATLPLLSAVAPFSADQGSGKFAHIDVPSGPLILRDLSAIYPFKNPLTGIRRTGAQIHQWLAHATRHFRQLDKGRSNQTLFDTSIAPYDCDVIFGLTYTLDLAQPPGSLARVQQICHQGHPIAHDDLFIVAANTHRVGGGGGYPAIPSADLVSIDPRGVGDILAAYVKTMSRVAPAALPPVRFAPLPKTSATFQSGPMAKKYMAEVTAFDLRHVEQTAADLHTFALWL